MEKISTYIKENTVGFSTDVEKVYCKSPIQRIHYEFCIIVRPGPLGLCLQPDPPRGIKVIQVYQESPYKNIIHNNDRIVSVNFFSVELASLHDLKLLLEAEGSKTLLVQRCLARPVTTAIANANMIPYPYTFSSKPSVLPWSCPLLENGDIPSNDDIDILEIGQMIQQDEPQQHQHHDSNHTKTINDDTSTAFETSKVGDQSLQKSIIAPASESLQNAKKVNKRNEPSKFTKKALLPTSAQIIKIKEDTWATRTASIKKKIKTTSLAASSSSHHLRGVTMRPSGKWQAQFYFAGKSQYIGVFDSREKAALAYEIARDHLKNRKARDPSEVEARISAARKAAFDGVNDTRDNGSSAKRNIHGHEVNGMQINVDSNSNNDDTIHSDHGNGHDLKTNVVNGSNAGINHGVNGTSKLVTNNKKSPSNKKRSHELSFPPSQDEEKYQSIRMTSDEDEDEDEDSHTSSARDNNKKDKYEHFIESNDDDHTDNDDKSSSTLNSSITNDHGRNCHPKSTSSQQSPHQIPENDTEGTDLTTQEDDETPTSLPPFTPTKQFSNINTNDQSPESTMSYRTSFDKRLKEFKDGLCDNSHFHPANTTTTTTNDGLTSSPYSTPHPIIM